MDGAEIADQIKKAELYEAVKQALMRLLDDPQVQQKITEVLWKQILQKP
jgi:DNA-binding TFAR19-related protein (PDSD5 family)